MLVTLLAASLWCPALGWELVCDVGEALRGFQSLYSGTKRDRVFWAPECERVEASSPTPPQPCPPAMEPSGPSWAVECEGFLTAMSGSRERQSLRCCPGPPIIPDSCHELSPGALKGGFRLSLQPAQIIKAVRSSYHHLDEDRRFHFKICTRQNVTGLDATLYKFYPSSRTTPFGSGAEWAYATLCVAGKFLRRLESLWSQTNGDRAVMGHCETASAASPAPACLQVREASLDGEAGTDAMMPPWAGRANRGCAGQEALSAWLSRRGDGLRRYSFGCCRLARPMIVEEGCYWERTEARAAFALSAPTGHVFRGIRAEFDFASRDRAFEVELCPLQGFQNSGGCLAVSQALSARSKPLVTEVFLHMAVKDVEACARTCDGHPFCLSAGYQPSRGGSAPVCLLSYRRSGPLCSAALLTPLRRSFVPTWLACIHCPSHRPAYPRLLSPSTTTP